MYNSTLSFGIRQVRPSRSAFICPLFSKWYTRFSPMDSISPTSAAVKISSYSLNMSYAPFFYILLLNEKLVINKFSLNKKVKQAETNGNKKCLKEGEFKMTYVSLDTHTYQRKPTGNEYKEIRLNTMNDWRKMNIKKLAEMVGENGCSMTPTNLIGGLKEENATAMQLFALDFDSGVPFAKIKAEAEAKGLPIAFAYNTFSSSENCERFRVVFNFEVLIEDMYIAKLILIMLVKIFKDCDSKCTNLDRCFLGGKHLLYVNEKSRIDFEDIYHQFILSMKTNNNYSREIKNFCNRNRIYMKDNMPFILQAEKKEQFDDFGPRVILHNIAGGLNSSFFIGEVNLDYDKKKNNKLQSSTRENKEDNTKQRRKNIQLKGCRLLEDFFNGEDIGHHGRLGVITNIIHIRSGETKFFETLKATDFDSYDRWLRRKFYLPLYRKQRCSSEWCKYCDSCDHAGTIYETLALDRKIYIEKETYYPREECEKQLNDNLQYAFHSHALGAHLIEAQTSLGKTTAYKRLVGDNKNTRFLIAAPTNALKEQIADDLKGELNAGENELFVTPSVKDNALIPDEIREEIARAHDIGNHDCKKKILQGYIDANENDTLKNGYILECKRILNGLKGFENTRVIVTTHAYLMTLSEDFLSSFTIIIDEDILQLNFFTRTNWISVTSLQEIARQNIPDYSYIAEEMLKSEEDVYYRANYNCDYKPDLDWISEMCFRTRENYGDILYTRSYVKCKDIHTGELGVCYFCPPALPKLKYIILSATIDSHLYERYFYGQLPVHTYPTKKARYQGHVKQFTYYSVSHSNLDDNLDIFEKVREINPNEPLPIITFKAYKKNNQIRQQYNLSDMHFGNSTGRNDLSGKDIAIVGTFYKIESEYKLVANYLGADVNTKADQKPIRRRVDYKGRNFLITTYNNPLLREVQLSAIESELEQCVGRARLLRNDCKVYVYSCFPCEQAEINQQNYL